MTCFYTCMCVYKHTHTQLLQLHRLVLEGYNPLKGRKQTKKNSLRPITKKPWVKRVFRSRTLLFLFCLYRSTMNKHEDSCPTGRCHCSLPHPLHLPLNCFHSTNCHEGPQTPPGRALGPPDSFSEHERSGVP